MKKRILAALLAALMVISMTACGNSGQTNAGTKQDGKQVWYLGGNNIMAGKVDVPALFQDVPDTVDPAKIYSSLTYNEELLRGYYTLNNKEKDLKTVRKELPFEEVAFKNGTWDVTVLPVAAYLGVDNICCVGTGYSYSEYESITDHAVAVLEFATPEKLGQVICIYEVSGNTVTFSQISKTSTGDEPFAYERTGVSFTYSFRLAGPYLTLSKGEHSLQLMAYSFTKNANSDLSMVGYSLPDSPLVGSLDYFSTAFGMNYAVKRDGNYYDLSAYKMDDEGRFTAYLAERTLSGEETERFVGQYAYIVQSEASSLFNSFNIILLDGEKIYYYTDNITKREARALEEQGADVGELTDDEIEQIAEKKADLFDDLYAAFQTAGINASINRSTGEIALDSTVLFGVNESQISDAGKEFLEKFMDVYTSVVLGEKYADFVSKIMVEGHTDTNGGYEMNMELSKARADSVKEYCSSLASAGAMQSMMEAVGYAYDKPVYDENGEVDMEASRRVSFRFVINVEKQD